jgi:hypothetical protein
MCIPLIPIAIAVGAALLGSSGGSSNNYKVVNLRCSCGHRQDEVVLKDQSFDYRTKCKDCNRANLELL